MSQLAPGLRFAIFYGIFGLLFVLYGFIVAGSLAPSASMFGSGLVAFVKIAPLALERLPGELAPAVLGGLLAWTAPLRNSSLRTVFLMSLSALVWLAYLHAQVIFQSEETLQAIGIADYPGDVRTAQGTLESFASSIRNFAAVVFAATIGLKLNDAMPTPAPVVDEPGDPASVPSPAPVPQEPEDVPDPALGQAKG
ncbi:hypothetical protein ASD04_18515 [Devosia sp. Root436]|uniref:hypothetical protein n=1 Tax=Devosia sp. Root436 TaxID=1736537 RepID=UPI0006F32B60|nr:hypothetical protein [Devosia sp. Root436]KQX42054.1 hypothetical protein ASD04_18515 [Devosia sp. Root436]